MRLLCCPSKDCTRSSSSFVNWPRKWKKKIVVNFNYEFSRYFPTEFGKNKVSYGKINVLSKSVGKIQIRLIVLEIPSKNFSRIFSVNFDYGSKSKKKVFSYRKINDLSKSVEKILLQPTVFGISSKNFNRIFSVYLNCDF